MKAPATRRRRGFTLIEAMLASFLSILVATLLANAWLAFGRPAVSAVARARLAQEANLFAEALAHDVGRLACPTGTQTDSRYQNVWVDDGATPAGSKLDMKIDEGTGSVQPVSYFTDPASADPDRRDKLFRADGDGERVVATFVSGFVCTYGPFPYGPDNADVYGVQIDLTLSHRVNERNSDGTFRADDTRRYRLFIRDPES